MVRSVFTPDPCFCFVIARFIDDVNDGRVPAKDTLCGGQAAEHVGSAEVSPEELDVKRVIESAEMLSERDQARASNSLRSNLPGQS